MLQGQDEINGEPYSLSTCTLSFFSKSLIKQNRLFNSNAEHYLRLPQILSKLDNFETCISDYILWSKIMALKLRWKRILRVSDLNLWFTSKWKNIQIRRIVWRNLNEHWTVLVMNNSCSASDANPFSSRGLLISVKTHITGGRPLNRSKWKMRKTHRPCCC